MRKQLPLAILAAFLLLFPGIRQAHAQEQKKSKVHVTITEGDKVTSDTTYELSGDQDPEKIKKMISHMCCDDMEMQMSHKGKEKLIWINEDGDHNSWTAESAMEGIDLDSIKEAHGGKKVMVMKDDDGEITVRELDDEDAEVYIIKSGDGEDVKVEMKKVKVIVEDEDELEVHKDADTEKSKKKKK